jgi:hypothetical protein
MQASIGFSGGITKAALAGLAGSALVFDTMQAANGASTETYKYTGALRDVHATDGAYDSTHAKVTIVQQDTDSTQFSIKITGIDTSAAGEKLGSPPSYWTLCRGQR